MPLDTNAPDSGSGDIAVFLLRLPQKNAHESTPQFRTAIDRLIRWTLVNQGFVAVAENIRTRNLRDSANVYTSVTDTEHCSFRARADFETGVCVVSIWHEDWTIDLFECAVRVVDWLISADMAKSVISVTPPSRFKRSLRLLDARNDDDVGVDDASSERQTERRLMQ